MAGCLTESVVERDELTRKHLSKRWQPAVMVWALGSDDRARFGALPLVVAAVGVVLLGYGASAHLSVTGVARCDGCAPWHPLFVVAPLVVGGLFVVVGSALFARR